MEQMTPTTTADAEVIRANLPPAEQLLICGKYTVECLDAEGRLKWRDEAYNTVVNVGKHWLLDNMNNAYPSVVGPYLGLVSSVSWSSSAAGDTMASHGGWVEAGTSTFYPSWSTPASNARGSTSWNAASAGSKALSSNVSFTISTGGTAMGCFIVLGTNAVATNNNTGGVLFSVGTFTSGGKVVAASDTLNVSYSVGL